MVQQERRVAREAVEGIEASSDVIVILPREEGPMDERSPLQYLGGGLQQVAFVVKDLTAGIEFFNRAMGVARFYVIENFGLQARDKTFRGHPVEHNFKLALAYSGDTQIELIQHLSGDTCYREHLERRGEGLHHLGFFLYDVGEYQRADRKSVV